MLRTSSSAMRLVCACSLNDFELPFLAGDVRREHAQECFVLHEENEDRRAVLRAHSVKPPALDPRQVDSGESQGAQS